MTRLEEIAGRLNALRRHAGKTDYASRVIDDCAWLVDEVVALRAQVEELTANGVSIAKAEERAYRQGYTDGQDDERAAVVAWLNHAADTRYYDCCCGPVAACAEAIERGEHRREGEK